MTTVTVVGTGQVGRRVVHHLVEFSDAHVVAVDSRPGRATAVADRHDERVRAGSFERAGDTGDIVVLAGPAAEHPMQAQAAIDRRAHVVTVTDSIPAVEALLALDGAATAAGSAIVVGAGFAPGLSCLLARHGANRFDQADEVHIAKAGTGGPACAREHHRALAGDAVDWRDGQWRTRRGRTGRELVFFPEPIGGRDCYRGALPDALLVAPALAGIQRVTARISATRRDRVTALLPMMRSPHDDGGPGAVRVEVRGRRGTATDVDIYGVMDDPSAAAGAVAAIAVDWVDRGRFPPGAGGLAMLTEPVEFLHELSRRGVRAAAFEG